MNDHDYSSLIASLNHAVGLLDQHRTPDPAYVAAHDTLKQARAMIEQSLGRNRTARPAGLELAA